MLETALLALDRHRRDAQSVNSAVALARKLRVSLRMAYVVDEADLEVPIPEHFAGALTRRVIRGTQRELELTGQARSELEAYASACEAAGVSHSAEVYVGEPKSIWVVEARSCDLLMIPAAQTDFEGWKKRFSNLHWILAERSKRPVLIFHPGECPENGIEFFYSNHRVSARSLPWVALLQRRLGGRLHVFTSKGSLWNHVWEAECRRFLDQHGVRSQFPATSAMARLDERIGGMGAREPDGRPILILDGGFRKGSCLRKHRRLVRHLIRNSSHCIVLCA